MLKKISVIIIGVLFVSTLSVSVYAAEYKASADLELFYESSEDVGGTDDNDKFKTNQLYFTVDGEFDNNMAARLKLDGADIISSDGKDVTHKIVEEANFTTKDIGGSPVSVVFGKDEMPFGLDYDKYLNDSITHQFEIDKVWGLHVIVDFPIGNFAVAAYEHRNGSAENEVLDNLAARFKVDKILDGMLVFELSAAKEEYVDAATGIEEDESKLSAGLIFKFLDGANVNLEYISFSNKGGVDDYDPALVTVGFEYKINTVKLFARYERIIEDVASQVEENFYTGGVSCTPVKNYTFSLEVSNFNSANLSDAKDLEVAEDSLETAVLLGVRAKF